MSQEDVEIALAAVDAGSRAAGCTAARVDCAPPLWDAWRAAQSETGGSVPQLQFTSPRFSCGAVLEDILSDPPDSGAKKLQEVPRQATGRTTEPGSGASDFEPGTPRLEVSSGTFDLTGPTRPRRSPSSSEATALGERGALCTSARSS